MDNTEHDIPAVAANAASAAGETLALIADLLRSIAEILTSATQPQDGDPDAERADPAAGAHRALQSVRESVQDILTRAAAATHGSNHPKVVQALTALRAALVEAGEAGELLQDTATDADPHKAEPQ